MLGTHNHIANYRTVIGRPKRNVCSKNSSTLRQIHLIRHRGEQLQSLSSAEFAECAKRLRPQVRELADTTVVSNVIESFALTGEALRRTTGMEYYDVQLLGGLALSAGTIAEIQTGEGKTITTALPAVLYGWTGKGVHVATTNDYLSKRDFDTLVDVYKLLGLTAGLLVSQSPLKQKQEAYACDITYGPGYEFGFDFLRDQLAVRSQYDQRLGSDMLRKLHGRPSLNSERMQRGHFMAIVDEADSVLIDEANTPLVLSGGKSSVSTSADLHHFANSIAKSLELAVDFEIDPTSRRINLTECGQNKVRQAWKLRPEGILSRPLSEMVINALRAQHLLRRDIDYVIQADEVVLVDANTGRLHEERKWSNGLHQAVEAKEQVQITDENETHARITRQRYTSLYQRVAGLTGTATGSEDELKRFYALPVVRIETHRPNARTNIAPRFFSDFKSKVFAITSDVLTRSLQGQPVLIGTASIAESQQISEQLGHANIPHVLLNGLQNDEEALIISRAGQAGAVTVATNMAGRGTDIKLDDQALAAGGLHVIATNHSHSSRIDRQLIGRAARQGAPGSCQFFIAADDVFIKKHSPALAEQMIATASSSGECNRDFSAAVIKLQKQVEEIELQRREQMVQHDRWAESVQSSFAGRGN
ncbi:preprotein translocase subunit SecA [Stieleria sp. JC731]|uniref:preprotein translocase subunit SecA n=1 Tax=Pirellulaceae TaxID=2691357 RepID=UPI001E381820|nr:preprotein translocase subunit SecA [Stieleria sp. JC731]MCC9599269.1 preprotein translocase subunit SecA [Stieleria sp. JC731]